MALIKWFDNRLKSLGIGFGVVVLAGGTALSQIVVILTSPIITRIYSPAEFGIFAAYASFFAILLTINSLRYEFAIPLADDEDSAGSLVALTLALVVISSMIFAVIFLIWGHAISALLNAPQLEASLWLLPFALLFAGFNQIFSYWLIWKKSFAAVSYSRFAQYGSQSVAQIGLGQTMSGAPGLVISHLIGLVIGMFGEMIRLRPFFRFIRAKNWRGLVSKHRNFPLYSTWSSLIDTIGVQVPAILFITYFGPDSAGFLSLAMRIVGIPSALIGQAVAQAIYPVLSEKKDDPEALRGSVERIASMLFIVAITAHMPLILYGSRLAAFALGAQWETTGYYASMLSLDFIVLLVASPLSYIMLVMGRQRLLLYLTILITVLKFGAILVMSRFGSAASALALYTIGATIVDIISLSVMLRLAGTGLFNWLRQSIDFIAVTIILLALLNAGSLIVPPNILMIVGIAGFGLSGLWFFRKYYMSGRSAP